MKVSTTAPKRPALRYHGGKFMLAPWIISHFPEHRIYIEPFGGGASVLLHKSRTYAEVYNDMDGEVVNLFRVLRNPMQSRELVRLVELTPYSREEFEESYLSDGDPIEQARRTLTRSFMSFGAFGAAGGRTGFRTGFRRSGPAAANDWRHYPEAMQSIIERMRGVTIEHMEAIKCIEFYDDESALIYADPPYPLSTRGTDAWYKHEMSDDDHRALARVLRSAKGSVVVSGYPCALYDEELFSDWIRIQRATHGDAARDRVEVLWIKPGTVCQAGLF
jgi:DNA adenine methylase